MRSIALALAFCVILAPLGAGASQDSHSAADLVQVKAKKRKFKVRKPAKRKHRSRKPHQTV